MSATRYPRQRYTVGEGSTVLQCDRQQATPVAVRPPLPGAVIVIHGVNDVGVAYQAVEHGLCAGLNKRMGWKSEKYHPADYRLPIASDKKRLEADPDAVFFKRKSEAGTYSPVIPFYWGYRERTREAAAATEAARHGQIVDRYGNRLDKDMSKGGGPFANATTTLPDMWDRGAARAFGAIDKAKHDPYRPVLKAPGRLYMVLAAKRLAALVAMIHDYNDADVISIVAHSQGCLISLLAQAFLLQQGERPADTLVLTHPPYSLVEPFLERATKAAESNYFDAVNGGEDAAMAGLYAAIEGRQTLRARLDTLIRIVAGVRDNRSTRAWSEYTAKACKNGIANAGWTATAERDNRGKVYLYFSPEDMTVGLINIQGIGWQGVPDSISGHTLRQKTWPSARRPRDPMSMAEVSPGEAAAQDRELTSIVRRPIDELGPSFLQRIFSAKLRFRTEDGKTSLMRARVGDPPPYVFPFDDPLASLGVPADDHAHAREDQGGVMVAHLQKGAHRTITGEKLPESVEAQLDFGSRDSGREEEVDQIDAAIAVTSDYGLEKIWLLMADDGGPPILTREPELIPGQSVFRGPVWRAAERKEQVSRKLNIGSDGKEKPKEERSQVEAVFACDQPTATASSRQLLVCRLETPNEARLRHQNAIAGRSFHGAIIGGPRNHEQVTAYDVAVGAGEAVSDPLFYEYLCAVADWRLKLPAGSETARPGILVWSNFLKKFDMYWQAEDSERKLLIEGNCRYYSSGQLPPLPLMQAGELPPAVISETSNGYRIDSAESASTPGVKSYPKANK